jgi:hypothetical protein
MTVTVTVTPVTRAVTVEYKSVTVRVLFLPISQDWHWH